MANIQVHCGFCGNEFEVPEDSASTAATCSKCGRQVAVPLPAAEQEGRVRLQVKRDTRITGGRSCPVCGAAMDESAVICVQCGYDSRTRSRYAHRQAPSRLLNGLLTAMGVLIFAGLVRVYLQRRAGPMILEAPARAPAESPTGTGAEIPEVPPPAATTTVSAAPGMPTQAVAAAATPTAATNPVPNAEEVNRAMVEEYRRSLIDWLDQKYPLYASGASAVLRRENGRVHRGVIFEIKPDEVTLLADGGQVAVPYAQLDQASRLRCDRVFRNRWVEYQVKKRTPGSKGP
ncbi:MAG: hypothetical protein V1873_05705 [Verrucomicrobiota bacterium]